MMLQCSSIHGDALLAALARHCKCRHNREGALPRACPGHEELALRGDTFAAHMEFGHYLAETNALHNEEWRGTESAS